MDNLSRERIASEIATKCVAQSHRLVAHVPGQQVDQGEVVQAMRRVTQMSQQTALLREVRGSNMEHDCGGRRQAAIAIRHIREKDNCLHSVRQQENDQGVAGEVPTSNSNKRAETEMLIVSEEGTRAILRARPRHS